MNIYIVNISTTNGPHGPTVNMTYHNDHQDALDEFTERLRSLGDDPSTIVLSRVDGKTMENTILDFFQGTESDYLDQWEKDYEESFEPVVPV